MPSLPGLAAPLTPLPPPARRGPPAELKAIDFGNNSMGKEGAYALADLLRGSSTIADVNINMNDVGDDGAFQVRPSLAAHGAVPAAVAALSLRRVAVGGQGRAAGLQWLTAHPAPLPSPPRRRCPDRGRHQGQPLVAPAGRGRQQHRRAGGQVAGGYALRRAASALQAPALPVPDANDRRV